MKGARQRACSALERLLSLTASKRGFPPRLIRVGISAREEIACGVVQGKRKCPIFVLFCFSLSFHSKEERLLGIPLNSFMTQR